MNFVFITAEVVQRPGLSETIETFGINKYDLIAQAICFLILAYVMNRFVFRPVMKMSDERRREAEEASANAEKIRKELKETEEARAEILHKAREHAEKIISETKAGADLLREQEKIRTEQLAAHILEKAHEDALLSLRKMKLELKNEIADMIVRLTAVLTEKNLNREDRARLLDSAVKAISSEAPTSGAGADK